MNNSISLSELSERVEQTIRLNFDKPVWVRAEIMELRVNGGHCYMELVEKAEGDDTIVAKCRATCWASTFRMLQPYFENATGQSLRAGLNVLVAVTVEYHRVYGMSLNVCDIDPVFTVGELAARRLQIMRRLEEEGVADMNRSLDMPQPAQRVAVVSSLTAAGYGDFCDQLDGNRFGYAFSHTLFPALMQGDGAAASIVAALEAIYAEADRYDVVVIIRGGGATADLAAFDSYDLAVNCAQFPLPVIAGIGHRRDVSILDMVAHTSVKTPTAAAEYLIANLQQAEERVSDTFFAVTDCLRERLERENRRLERIEWRRRHALQDKTTARHLLLDRQLGRLRMAVKTALAREENRLDGLYHNVRSYSPAFMLERGYTFTTLNGRRLLSSAGLKPGDCLRTFFPDGTVDSEVL